MNKNDVIQRLNELNFDKKEYWLITGGAMVLYGIREETGDIDLGCTTKMADELQKQGCSVSVMDNGMRKIAYADDVEIFENWLCGEITEQEGFPVLSLNGLIEMKRQIGREKDFRDIALIEQFSANKMQ